MSKSYYIYIYYDQNDIPFYIGKGTSNRFYIQTHLDKRQPYLCNKILKVGIDNVKVWKSGPLSEEDAFYAEQYYIMLYGRKNDKDFVGGTLCNLTDGGDGQSKSEETKRKISETRFKNKCGTGQRSEITKQRMREAWKQRTPMSIETREKIRAWHKGRKLSLEHKTKIGKSVTGIKNGFFGRHHTEETRQRISAALRKHD